MPAGNSSLHWTHSHRLNTTDLSFHPNTHLVCFQTHTFGYGFSGQFVITVRHFSPVKPDSHDIATIILILIRKWDSYWANYSYKTKELKKIVLKYYFQFFFLWNYHARKFRLFHLLHFSSFAITYIYSILYEFISLDKYRASI